MVEMFELPVHCETEKKTSKPISLCFRVLHRGLDPYFLVKNVNVSKLDKRNGFRKKPDSQLDFPLNMEKLFSSFPVGFDFSFRNTFQSLRSPVTMMSHCRRLWHESPEVNMIDKNWTWEPTRFF